MLVTRFDPFREFNELRRGFEHLNSAFNSLEASEKDKKFDFVPIIGMNDIPAVITDCSHFHKMLIWLKWRVIIKMAY